MKKIPLNVFSGSFQFASVDDEDYDLVSSFNWTENISASGISYARTEVEVSGNRICFLMHRFILGTSPEVRTDHRDGDGLNNQRENLRICDASGNAKNRKLNSDNSSGFKGVHSCYNGFRAVIFSNKKKFHLGVFRTPKDAALAYDQAAVFHHGEFARTNRMMGLL